MKTDLQLADEPRLKADVPRMTSLSVRPGGVLWLGVWIGLTAGFGDVVLLFVKRRWIERDFFHVDGDFPWIIPCAVTALVLVPAMMVGLFAKIRGSVRLAIPVGLLSFVGLLDMFARLPLELWASMIISGGIAAQLVRIVGRRQAAFLKMASSTVWVLVAVWLLAIMSTAGARAWSEHRQTTSLPAALPGAQNVLLIVWDTVRAANTSLYGYGRNTTPHLAKLATQGVRFDRAFSTSSWTLPAHAGLFTGRWPHELGVGWKSPMRQDVPTLAESLAGHGYETAGFVANLDYCGRESGLARGFARYEDFPLSIVGAFRSTGLGRRIDLLQWPHALDAMIETRTGHWYNLIPRSKEHMKTGESIDLAFLGWLKSRSESTRPFFAFLNYNDAHSPYEVPDEAIPGFGSRPKTSIERQTLVGFTGIDKTTLSIEDVRMLNDVYDDSIYYLDRRLGYLLDQLERVGKLENTLVIVTSDHGEHLGDHGLFFHGNSLYRQVVEVPLVIVGKRGVPVGQNVSHAVGLNEIPATVINLLGLKADRGFPGRSLARYWQRGVADSAMIGDALLMETTKPTVLTNDGREPAAKGPMKAIMAGGMHYIQMADGSEELFKMSDDVEENVNLANHPDMPPVLAQFRSLLGLMLQKRP